MKDCKVDISFKGKTNHRDHTKNISLRRAIIKMFEEDEKELIVEYDTKGSAAWYRKVALEFLDDIQRIKGVDVCASGCSLIITRYD